MARLQYVVQTFLSMLEFVSRSIYDILEENEKKTPHKMSVHPVFSDLFLSCLQVMPLW